MVREYVYLNGEPVAQVDAGSPEGLTYLHPDHLGTPRYATNTSGTQVWSWNNDAFGTSTPSGTATVNLRMPGQYFDAESGLFYNWNRYYNPAIGRYISADPIGLDGGLNMFLYAANSPVMLTDPYGLYSWWDFQGDLANTEMAGLQGLAGLTDTLTLGTSRTYRQQNGLEYIGPCSGAYIAGDYFGSAVHFAAASGILKAVASSPALEGVFGRGALLFKRGGGLLNNNNYLRIGWGWKGDALTGKDIFRIVIGNKNSWVHWHLPLW